MIPDNPGVIDVVIHGIPLHRSLIFRFLIIGAVYNVRDCGFIVHKIRSIFPTGLLKLYYTFIKIHDMRSLVLALMSTLPFSLFAQGVFTNQTNTALQEVIGDYPNQFKNIQGDLLSAEAQTTDYYSKVSLPGAVSAVITRYSSSGDNMICSWKCLLSQSEDFDVIAPKYKELYNQLKNSIIKIDGQKPFILNGIYEMPTERKKFTTSEFYLLPSIGTMGKLKIELTLEYYVTEWKMAILVYDQKAEGSLVME